MKLGIPEKLALIITLIIVVSAGISLYKKFNPSITANNYVHISYINGSETKKLPADVAKISTKYQSYENLYHSDKKVFAYGYKRYTTNKNEGKNFHKQLQAKLAENDFGYEVVVYENPEDYDNDVKARNIAVYLGDAEKCLMEEPSVQELNSLRQATTDCLNNVCIIDLKKNEYTIMSRDVDYIIEQLKQDSGK